MPQIIPSTGKKLTHVTAAGKAAALSASNLSGQDIDPCVQRPFALDPSQIQDQAALEAISAASQQPQKTVASTVTVPVGAAIGNGQDVVEDSALLVELHSKIDKLLHKRGLCDTDDDASDAGSDLSEDDEEEEEQVVAAKPKSHKRQIAKDVTVEKPLSKKQKLAEELTAELDQQVSGGAVVQQNVVGVSADAIGSGSVASLISQASAKLDKLLADESDSETDGSEDDDEEEDDE